MQVATPATDKRGHERTTGLVQCSISRLLASLTAVYRQDVSSQVLNLGIEILHVDGDGIRDCCTTVTPYPSKAGVGGKCSFAASGQDALNWTINAAV